MPEEVPLLDLGDYLSDLDGNPTIAAGVRCYSLLDYVLDDLTVSQDPSDASKIYKDEVTISQDPSAEIMDIHILGEDSEEHLTVTRPDRKWSLPSGYGNLPENIRNLTPELQDLFKYYKREEGIFSPLAFEDVFRHFEEGGDKVGMVVINPKDISRMKEECGEALDERGTLWGASIKSSEDLQKASAYVVAQKGHQRPSRLAVHMVEVQDAE